MAENTKSENATLQSLVDILNIDDELARYYLERTRWSVEGAINEYYLDTSTDLQPKTSDKPPLYSEAAKSLSIPCSSFQTLKLLCWNLDGLDEKNLEERTRSVVDTILFKKPDVVLLQEVVAPSLKFIQQNCHGYLVLTGDGTIGYFNAILIRTATVQTQSTSLKTVSFPGSVMGRHYLIHPIKFAEAKIVVMTSHLESCKENATERKRQFSEILDYMKRQNGNFNVIFGGDTNLRDVEVKAVGGIPVGILDAWESCGSNLTTKYTWDMVENDNLAWPYPTRPQLRFDRIFVRPAIEEKAIKPNSFSLVGKNRMKNCARFASDHWGIWLELEVE